MSKVFFSIEMCLHVQEEDTGNAADSQKELASARETMTKASRMVFYGGHEKRFVTVCTVYILNLRKHQRTQHALQFRCTRKKGRKGDRILYELYQPKLHHHWVPAARTCKAKRKSKLARRLPARRRYPYAQET